MKRMILPLLILLALIVAVPSASFAGKGRGHYKHHRHGNYYGNRSYFTGNFYYGGPVGYYPRPYVYAPPPPPVVYGPPVYVPPPVYYGPVYPPVQGNLFFGITID